MIFYQFIFFTIFLISFKAAKLSEESMFYTLNFFKFIYLILCLFFRLLKIQIIFGHALIVETSR